MKADDLLFHGFALFKSGRFKEAADHFRSLTFLNPREGRFWVTLAHTLRRAGEKDQAIDAYKTSLLLGQDSDPEVLLSLAELLKDRHENEEAKVLLDEAMRIAPPDFKKHLEFINLSWFQNSLQRL